MTHDPSLPGPDPQLCQQVQGILSAIVLPSHEELLAIAHQASLRVTAHTLQCAMADEHDRLSWMRAV